MPRELLNLLPPPPDAGWPKGFGLARIAESSRKRARLNALIGQPTDPAVSVPELSEDYPLLRRTSRLSYAIWAVITGSEENAPLQRVLEEASIAERLRYAVLRMRVMTGRSFRPPGA